LTRAHGWLTEVRGLRRCAVATAFGALAALAMPPWHAVVLLLPAFTVLIWQVEAAARGRVALLVGWCFGFGYFLAGTYWVGIAMLVDAERHAWLLPFAVGGLAAGLAIFPAACAVAYHCLLRFGAVSGAGRIVAFAGIWMVMEWVRGWIFTGFPWNSIGYAWAGTPAALQATALIGVYGLGLITVVAAAMPAAMTPSRQGSSSRQAVLAVVIFTVIVPFGSWAGGAARLMAAPAAGVDLVPDVRLRLVQAYIPQSDKWLPELGREHLMRHLTMSRSAGSTTPTHVVWPEAAISYFLSVDEAARKAVARAAPPGGVVLTGAPRVEVGAGQQRFWNSIYAIDGAGNIVAMYDKTHLVPFGEYVPGRGILPVEKIVAGVGDFTPGPGVRSLRVPGLPPFGALVCYEVIFPGAVVDRHDRPEWILNLTNDAWFGDSAGPWQHLASARVRAIEEGLPLVRAAGTGVSAVIDPYGRTVAQLGVGETGVIDSGLPRAATATPFARFGNWSLLPLTVLAVVLAFVLRGRDSSAVGDTSSGASSSSGRRSR
jgi:apolipoprotein N-acyltransferase